MRRTKDQAAETGRQILAAAENLFLEKGYESVSLEEIAAAAGVTRGAIQWHFKNKQGLLKSLRDAVQEPFANLAETLAGSKGTATLDLLGQIVSEMFERLERDPRQRVICLVVMRLDISAPPAPGASGSTFHNEMRVTLQRIFQSVHRDGGLSDAWPPRKAATTFGATISGLVMEWALEPSDFHLSSDGSDLIKTILAAWRPDTSSRAH